jgi:hypothetical protein
MGLAAGLTIAILMPKNETLSSNVEASSVVGVVTPTVLSFPLDPTYTPATDVRMSVEQGNTCSQSQMQTQQGTTIAQGSNTQPTPLYGLRSYRVEEVVLPAPVTCVVQVPATGATSSGYPVEEQTKTFDRFWRVSVAGDRVDAPISEGWYIWLDTQLLGYSPAGKELVTFVYDRTLLREGGIVGVTYGAGSRETVSTPLHLSP